MFEWSTKVRYMEVDAQGVVFNGWYLTYFDEAFSAFLAARGLPYSELMDASFDVQLVRSEIDWKSGLGRLSSPRMSAPFTRLSAAWLKKS